MLQSIYLRDKKIAAVRDNISAKNFISDEPIEKLLFSTALVILIARKIRKRSYIDIRLLLKSAGQDILYTYQNLNIYIREKKTYIRKFKDLHKEIRIGFKEDFKISAHQLLKNLISPKLRNFTGVN